MTADGIVVHRDCYTSHTQALRLYILGLVDGLPSPIRQECPLVVLRAYVDDTNKGNEPVFALGGLVAPVEKWLLFSDAWDAKLREHRSIAYFKASEAAGLSGQFWGWSAAERDRKVAELIPIINDCAISYLGCAVVKEDWHDVFHGKMAKTMDTPVYFSYMRIITILLGAMYYRADLSGVAEFIFDEENQTIYREILNFWLEAKKEYPRRFRKRMGNDPVMRDDKKVVPLQAADMIAWTLGKLSSPPPYPDFAISVAEQLSIGGIGEVWDKSNLGVFSAGVSAHNANNLFEYETGKQRSVRLKELLGPRE